LEQQDAAQLPAADDLAKAELFGPGISETNVDKKR
jgi:hypothetical protein